MTLPTLKDMTGIIKRDQLLPCDEGRRQYDIQEQVSKITSRIDAILRTNNPCAARKFYMTDYVLVPADLLILKANIMKLSELLENISDMDRYIKAHLNTLFHLKTGNLIRGEEYSNRLMKMLLQGLMKLSVRQVRWLTKMAKNGHLTERAITTAKDYLDGFMEESTVSSPCRKDQFAVCCFSIRG